MTDVAQGWVANAPVLVPSEAAGSTTLAPSVGDATGSAGFDAAPSFFFIFIFYFFSVSFGSSLGSNPRGQVVLVSVPVTTLQWFPGRLLRHHASVVS